MRRCGANSPLAPCAAAVLRVYIRPADALQLASALSARHALRGETARIFAPLAMHNSAPQSHNAKAAAGGRHGGDVDVIFYLV